TPNEAPPGPELSEVVPEPEPPPPVELKPPEAAAEVQLPEPEPPPPVDLKPPPRPKPIEKAQPKPPQPRVVAPQAAPTEAPRAAAPTPGASLEPPSRTLPTWKGLLLRHLERHKRYPSEAQRHRQEGMVLMRFTMSREGRVLAARVERASGVTSLDQEGLDLLQRAQPLPALPADQPGETLELVVPIQFYLRR
ncbi:MAG: energy transducer TonB family protein, partial [Solimonas sp.]